MREFYRRLSTSKKVIVIVFGIWLIQAIPKWSAALLMGDEFSAALMRVFIDPKA